MTKKVAQWRNLIISLLILEILVAVGLYTFLMSMLFLVLMIYIIAKNILIFISLAILTNILDSETQSVAEALDVDSRNALVFGGVGLIQYDENYNITWVSDLLVALNVRIVGVKLLEWQPTLASLFENDEIRIVELKGRKFEVYNSEETRLLFLKDVTQYVSMKQDYDDQQMCVGYITIDNYEETLNNVDEEKMSQIRTQARHIINEWATSNGMIIRSYRTGGYLLFFNERIYAKQVENKFAILNTFKDEMAKFDEVMTLSIGIGRGTRVLRELEQMATQALNLTYSRGGDQVAIKSGKDKVRYFGGTTESVGKSSKVRTRVIAQTLSGLIRRSSNVLVMGHQNSDLDSLGASLGAARIAQGYDKKVNVILRMDSLEDKTGKVVEEIMDDPDYESLILSPADALEVIGKDTLLIVVDTHKPELVISQTLLNTVKNRVVIDHHRRDEAFIESPILTYLESSASSAVELLIELSDYQRADVHITETDATIMYAGMLVDTNYFRQRTGVRTFNVAAKLKELSADVPKAYDMLRDSFEETVEVLQITENAYRYGKSVLIAEAKEEQEHTRTILAKCSNQMLNISGVNAAFTIARVGRNMVAISARSSGLINVQVIMEAMGGGGHFTMAACQKQDTSIHDVRIELEKAIDDYFKNTGE